MNDHDMLQRLDDGMGADADVMPDHVFNAVISALPDVRRHRRQWNGLALFAAAAGGAAIAAAVTWIVLMTGLPGRQEVGPPGPSPRGDELVVSIRSPQGADLALATVATGEISPLASMPGDELQPAWSPDGNTVVFVNQGDLYTVDVGSRTVTQLTATPEVGEAGPAFSPAGDEIAFSTDTGATMTIWTMPSEGGDPRSVTEFDAPFACCPSWSPDGSSLAVAVDRSPGGGQIDLYVVDVDSGMQTQLTDTPGDDASHEWSPDGELIAFQADQEFGLVVMRPDGTDRKLLTRVSDTGFGITWSPDSMRIAFVSFGVVSVIGADGSGEAELLDIAGSVIEDVAWRP